MCLSYLANRKQYFEYNNAKSKLTDINVVVPQGSIMGTLLFIIYINDIIFSSDIFKFIMYADDTTLFTSIKNSNEDNVQIHLINKGLSKISDWLLANKLSLNAAKTKFMVFNMPQKNNIPALHLANSQIECVDSFNFLGITVDRHIYWTTHTGKIACKISRTIGVLNRLKHIIPKYIPTSVNLFNFTCVSLKLRHISMGP